ncbi:MAG TPA: hypothetical protein DCX95_05920 [Elusimicrobia bacterium]|nr:hypothetical protein [Elusimicrobiota bacterium]
MDLKIRKLFFPVALFITDIFAVYFSFVFAYWLRFYSGFIPVPKGIPLFELYHTAIIVAIFLWEIIFIYNGFYSERKIDTLNEFLKICKGVFLGTLVIAAITFLYRDFTFSRAMLALASVVSAFVIFIFHEMVRFIDAGIGNALLGVHKILILGEGKLAEDLIRILRKNKNVEVHHSGNCEERNLKNYIFDKGINEVIFSKSHTAHNEIIRLADICEELGVDFRFVPDVLEMMRGEVLIDDFLGLPVLRFKSISLYGWNFFVKRFMDVVFSICIFSFLAVPLLIIAIAIKITDGGSVFFLHKNMVGYRWDKFAIYKFRTMLPNPEKKFSREEILHLSTRRGEKAKYDPRVTKIGKFLRRFSLDEIPQFINVLRGEMSIVGPRPQTVIESNTFDSIGKRRFKVLPGITGLWQVRGRKNLSYEEMLRLDVYYLENWSVALDIKIIVRTIPAILTGKGAY